MITFSARDMFKRETPGSSKTSVPTYWTTCTWHHIWEGLTFMSLHISYSQTHGLTVHEKAMHQSFKMFTAYDRTTEQQAVFGSPRHLRCRPMGDIK